MSSEGSVSTSSSGIRQFGLYRTIDARTEEFLRLSRKRQIRQGCACAAISTAITVTIVVGIILIYEYNTYEPNPKTALKSNWFSFTNKSTDAFEEKLNKARINVDRVKFLPLILNTLKKNEYFDKILEDVSTQSILHDKVQRPKEAFYTKNVFSDTRNWMRMPTSRLYAVEYKTSPIVYFKNPTRNIEYFTKVRRIRDYERVMNYVDKMISEKVPFGSTIAILKKKYSFRRKSAITTTPMTKIDDHVTENQIGYKKPKYPNKVSLNDEIKTTCRCSKTMSELLNKLIKGLQKLIPDSNNNDNKFSNFCNNNKINTIKTVTKSSDLASSKAHFEEPTRNDSSTESLDNFVAYFNNTSLETNKHLNISNIFVAEKQETPSIKLITNLNDQSMMPSTISKTFYSLEPFQSNTDYSLNSIIESSELKFHKKFQDNKHIFTTTSKQFIEGTDANYFLEGTTKPMSKLTSSSKILPNTFTKVKNMLEGVSNNTKFSLKFPTFSDNEYEEYTDSTPNIVNNYKIQDVHNTELIKKKIMAPTKKKKNSKEEVHIETFKTTHVSNYHNKIDHNNKTPLFRTISESNNYGFKKTAYETVTENYFANLNTKSNSSLKSGQLYLKEKKLEDQLNIQDITLEEEEVDKAPTEEFPSESNLKSLENMIKLNYNETLVEESSELNQRNATNIKDEKGEGSTESLSMIPQNKQSYLEIKRNDWKRDDNQDYDNNMNNYYFE